MTDDASQKPRIEFPGDVKKVVFETMAAYHFPYMSDFIAAAILADRASRNDASLVATSGFIVCPCTTVQQDETCPVGYPSLLCDECNGKGIVAAPEPRALLDIVAERRRQISEEGWTTAHDDEHAAGELPIAAACYAEAAGQCAAMGKSAGDEFEAHAMAMWPWSRAWWKPGTARRMLVKAGALILAEIERIDRAKSAEGAE